MSHETLQDVIDGTTDLVAHFRSSKIGKHVYPVVPAEFTNWMSEQLAWRNSVALFDQTHHMDNFFIQGPDALKLVSDTGIGSVANFDIDRAKQFTTTAPNGRVIGDGIMFRESADSFTFVGRAPTVNWLSYQAEVGGYDVETVIDRRSPSRPRGPASRRLFRFEVQGPLAWQVLEKLHGAEIPESRFFRMGHISIDGLQVRTLRHGVAGQPGLELWGPYDEHDRVRDAILAAGAEFGMLSVGSRAYPSVSGEVGWIPSPLPAIYTGEELADYRRWLRADSFEAVGSITGSFESVNVEDYYLTPWDLGYGRFVKFDHDFHGREALERLDTERQRGKVTLEWNAEDLTRVMGTLFDPAAPTYKFFDLPNATYGTANYDAVRNTDGDLVGFSTYTSYSYNERRALSLGIVDADIEIGTELELVWGEPGGGRDLVVIPPHEQTTIRAVVRPAPYSADTRQSYEGGGRWRNAARR
ncbi:glycine cleavage system protein T [Pseudoclavibacter endophyticus]|uniref:Aminomethyl transferase family protein n=1 Tax=Pseudoclavibacter endophyticus TaxID=1778590 RepID=A0A6H9WMT9_9MICO|nr:aminomethyltransferase family protein [Pseudoclavibacter endophyticus]KAB1648058.1 aminomethyl transferase family protein [Pseudoclavibacter endophyticus]GGA69348.1 glycine cleavage system protein T [Pseudoclavibacter endophyticus]